MALYGATCSGVRPRSFVAVVVIRRSFALPSPTPPNTHTRYGVAREFVSGFARSPAESIFGAAPARPPKARGPAEDLIKRLCKDEPSERLPMKSGGSACDLQGLGSPSTAENCSSVRVCLH